jgi:hypothetical protein
MAAELLSQRQTSYSSTESRTGAPHRLFGNQKTSTQHLVIPIALSPSLLWFTEQTRLLCRGTMTLLSFLICRKVCEF